MQTIQNSAHLDTIWEAHSHQPDMWLEEEARARAKPRGSYFCKTTCEEQLGSRAWAPEKNNSEEVIRESSFV